MTLDDVLIRLPSGPALNVRRPPQPASTDGAPFLLVHGLASNARVWDDVSSRLADAGHDVAAVDLRGHGRSEQPADGYDTPTAAADLAALCAELGWDGDRAPIVAGQSWGGNVVLTLAARHGVPRAVALLDGGWLRPHGSFPTFEQCWAALAPPRFDGLRYDDLAAHIRRSHPDWPEAGVVGTLANLERLPDGGVRARLSRENHRSILHSLWEADPREVYPDLVVPALLMPAASPHLQSVAAQAVLEMAAAVPGARVHWYAGADHDLHAQHPDRVARDLLSLAEEVAGR